MTEEPRAAVLFLLDGLIRGETGRPYPGVASLLRELRERRYRIGVVVQGGGPDDESAGWAEVAPYVDLCVRADRPDARLHDLIDTAVAALRIPRRRMLLVVASGAAAQIGRATGLRTVAALWGAADVRELIGSVPDGFLDEPGDLLKICVA